MSMYDLQLQEASARTGFDLNDRFETVGQVYDYFTPGEQRSIYGDDAVIDADLLDEWAQAVVATGFHCTPALQAVLGVSYAR